LTTDNTDLTENRWLEQRKKR